MKHTILKYISLKVIVLITFFILITTSQSIALQSKAIVTKVSGKIVTATLNQSVLVRKGDEAAIALWIEGVGEIPIKGIWFVNSVSGRAITLKPGSSDNAQPMAGQRVTIKDTRNPESRTKKSILEKYKPTPVQKKLYDTDIRPTEVILEEANNYYYGMNGKPQDYDKSFTLNQISAQRGNAEAIYNLGVAYTFGHGILANINTAYTFYKQAAEKGSSRAAFNLAAIYYQGLAGIRKDNTKAMHYMRQAVIDGDTETYHGIGNFYRLGIGVDASLQKAIFWYKKGAKSGNQKCQEQLNSLGVK